MKNLVCLIALACALAACGGGNEANTPSQNTPQAALPTVDTTGAAQVARQMLETALKGSTEDVKAFMVQAEREAGGKGINFNINDKGNMKGFEIGETKMEGENAIVSATILFTDDTPPQQTEMVMKKEGDTWRLSVTETAKREMKKRLTRD